MNFKIIRAPLHWKLQLLSFWNVCGHFTYDCNEQAFAYVWQEIIFNVERMSASNHHTDSFNILRYWRQRVFIVPMWARRPALRCTILFFISSLYTFSSVNELLKELVYIYHLLNGSALEKWNWIKFVNEAILTKSLLLQMSIWENQMSHIYKTGM